VKGPSLEELVEAATSRDEIVGLYVFGSRGQLVLKVLRQRVRGRAADGGRESS
jgi:hypothetical protein